MIQTTPALVKPIVVPDLMTAFDIGKLDAELGEIPCPEMYFARRGQKVDYCKGYESVKGACETTAQFTGSVLPVVLTDEDMAAHLADLMDGIDTDNSHRMMMGGW